MEARRQAETQSTRVTWELLAIYPVTGFSAEKVKKKETPVMDFMVKISGLKWKRIEIIES